MEYLPADWILKLDEMAGLYAHLMNLGKPLAVGEHVCFAHQLKDETGKPKTDKLWLMMVITQPIIDRAKELLAAERVAYEDKMSMMPTEGPASLDELRQLRKVL